MDREMPALVLRPRLLEAGYTDDELRRWRADRQLVTVRPCVYARTSDIPLLDPAARHALEEYAVRRGNTWSPGSTSGGRSCARSVSSTASRSMAGYCGPAKTPADAVVAEKRREDAIRDTGLRVRRWGWDDLDNFGPVATRLRQTFDAS